MKTDILQLTIERIPGVNRFAIVDRNRSTLAEFDRIFDAAICLRFMMGKSMSRLECDLAVNLLKKYDERKSDDEEWKPKH